MQRFFSFFQKRRREMREVASTMGFDFQETDDYGLIAMMKEFTLFKRGYGKRITNIISNKIESEQTDLRVFDYRFVIGGGNSTRVIKQTVFYVHSKKLNLPQLLIKPEGFLSRISEYFGGQDIDFEAFPVFSNQYTVRGNEPEVRETLTDDFLNYFTHEKKWWLEGLNYLLIFYINGKRISPDQIESFYNKGHKVFELLSRDNPEDLS